MTCNIEIEVIDRHHRCRCVRHDHDIGRKSPGGCGQGEGATHSSGRGEENANAATKFEAFKADHLHHAFANEGLTIGRTGETSISEQEALRGGVDRASSRIIADKGRTISDEDDAGTTFNGTIIDFHEDEVSDFYGR